MEELTGLYHAVSAVLVVGGLAKLRRPRALEAMAVAATRRRVPPGTGRVVGSVEVIVGVAAIATGARGWAAATVALYLAFTAVVAVAARRGVATCGCFGAADAPPGPIHVTVDVVAAAVAGAMVVDPPGSLGSVLADQPWLGLPYVGTVLVLAALLLVALTDAAAALAEVRRSGVERRARAGRTAGGAA